MADFPGVSHCIKMLQIEHAQGQLLGTKASSNHSPFNQPLGGPFYLPPPPFHLFLCQALLCNSPPPQDTVVCVQHWEVVSVQTWDERRSEDALSHGFYYHFSDLVEAEPVLKQGLTGWWPLACVHWGESFKPNMSNKHFVCSLFLVFYQFFFAFLLFTYVAWQEVHCRIR